MHPVLFSIPLPHRPLKLWWGLAVVALVVALYALWVWRREHEKRVAQASLAVAVALGVGGYLARAVEFQAESLPIYSYGVMLGLSLVVGWYLTLGLAERDGLPKETMANCYVFTAVCAIAGARILYILTNLDEFTPFTFASIFALRRGGLVAYGGFLGGFLGSWVYLARNKLRLMPWADVAVPSLASGLFITRIGCYLFGCDFGARLSPEAPGWLQKMGTFPHWSQGTLGGGEGSPAWVRHLEEYRGTPLGAELLKNNHSFPVHPTQIYESAAGLLLLVLLLWQRKSQKFRGQIFFTFAFAYGVARFLIEIIRDDPERGSYGPMMAQQVLLPGALLLMALAFIFGIALGIESPRGRTIARVVALVPPVALYLLLKPEKFGDTLTIQLSTSQLIGLGSALLVSYYYAKFWSEARKNPQMAMSLGSGAELVEAVRDRKREEEDEEEEEEERESEEESDDREPAPET